MRGCDWVTNLGNMGKMSIARDDSMKGYDPKIPGGKHTEIDGWFKIEDAPRDGTEILAWIKYNSREGYGVIKSQNSTILPWTDDIRFSYKDENILGWMPLPKPPKIRHKCIDSQNYAMCVIREGETDVFSIHRRVLNRSIISEYEFVCDCSFCPFCGQKAGE